MLGLSILNYFGPVHDLEEEGNEVGYACNPRQYYIKVSYCRTGHLDWDYITFRNVKKLGGDKPTYMVG